MVSVCGELGLRSDLEWWFGCLAVRFAGRGGLANLRSVNDLFVDLG